VKDTANNYAFIDGTNLHLTMVNLGWALDYKRFRIYLQDKYNVTTAYYFLGFVEQNSNLYRGLQKDGFILIFKPTLTLPNGAVKGNVDAELVLQAMVDYPKYDQAVIVASDGDYGCLVKYLRGKDKLKTVLAPCLKGCSSLLMKAAGSQIAFLDNLRNKLQYMKNTP
jgi:uncharacterized LabA/DUF88 family protein